MKVKDIQIGQTYAVRLVLPYAAGMARTAPIIHAKAADIAGNTIVLLLDAADCGLQGATLDRLRAQRQRLFPSRTYPSAQELIRVKAANVVCLSDEWAPPALDGRMDAPTVTRAAGKTFTQNQMASA